MSSEGRALISRVTAALVAMLLWALPSAVFAHEIPNDVTVRAFVKPEGERLYLLLRVPLAAMRDIDFPKRGPGYLDLARVETALRHAAKVWIADNIEFYEGETRLEPPQIVACRVSLPSDRSFESYEEALAAVKEVRLPEQTQLYWNQGLLDVLFQYRIRSENSDFALRPRFEGLALRVITVIVFLPPSGAERAFELVGEAGLVRLDPRWHQAAWRFVELGFRHILDGIDHLLFLLCLVIPLRRLRSLFVVVTAFTLAHSITLVASAYELAPDSLWFPALVETLIALSIVYMALENIVGSKLERRWIVAFGFGLIHGFGFSFALRQTLQFAGSHLLVSLVSFNVGIELGQLLVLLLLIPVLELLFRFVVAERIGVIILSALVAHTGWHWMVERAAALSQFRWPELGETLLTGALGLVVPVLILVGLVWLVLGLRRRRAAETQLEATLDEDGRMKAEG